VANRLRPGNKIYRLRPVTVIYGEMTGEIYACVRWSDRFGRPMAQSRDLTTVPLPKIVVDTPGLVHCPADFPLGDAFTERVFGPAFS
jgi:hypothetical protein